MRVTHTRSHTQHKHTHTYTIMTHYAPVLYSVPAVGLADVAAHAVGVVAVAPVVPPQWLVVASPAAVVRPAMISLRQKYKKETRTYILRARIWQWHGVRAPLERASTFRSSQ